MREVRAALVLAGIHKRLDWWDQINPSSTSSDCQELGTGHQSTNMAKVPPPWWEGMERATACSSRRLQRF